MSEFLFISPEVHFTEVVKEACERRKVTTQPALETYLVHLLKYFLDSRNLFAPMSTHQENAVQETSLLSVERPPETLAEMYLVAINCELNRKKDIMKDLADRALYISGFFGDSLNNKLIDVEYYADMGANAYAQLAHLTKEDQLCSVYSTFSQRFRDYVEVLNYISEKSLVQADRDVLKLYDKYLKTGSESARQKLNELGIVTLPKEQLKLHKA